MAAALVHLLEVDPDLGENLEPVAREEATKYVRARVFKVAPGPWHPQEINHATTGLLLLSGLMVRTVHLGPTSSSEVVGPTDILRPWETDLIRDLIPAPTDWRVLEESRVALLDEHVTTLLGRWPELSAAVSSRLLRRARSLAYLMAAQHFLRVEDRLLATLWHLAGMWGRVTPRGVVVPFRLTQDMLADIIGAQRPTTTGAIRSLERQGRLARDERRRYVLLGDPPDWRGEQTRAALGRLPIG
jgi:CRP/FNR family transcriptional regulator, cyclic AMP receptor protein